MNDLFRVELKEIVTLQDITKTDKLHYKSNCRKVYNFNEYLLSIVFLRDIHEWHLSFKDGVDEQSNVVAKLKNLDKGKKKKKLKKIF